MQVPCDEGLAIPIVPESCAGAREGFGEALTGERIGQPSSRERSRIWVPTMSKDRKATQLGASSASAQLARRGRRPWHVRTLLVREPGDLTADQQLSVLRAVLVRVGKVRSRSR